MNRLFLTLSVDLTEQSPQGAGWYIQASSDGQAMIPLVPISLEGAQELAGAFQTALKTTEGEIPQVTFPQLVQSANALIRQALEKQLRYAEEQAAKIAMLRRKLSQAPPPLREIERPTA